MTTEEALAQLTDTGERLLAVAGANSPLYANLMKQQASKYLEALTTIRTALEESK